MSNTKTRQPVRLPVCLICAILLIWAGLFGCGNTTDGMNTLEVTATAYTSRPHETDATPDLTAWGDTLKPGMKAIAVSRELIDKGLPHGAKVSIEGLRGAYTVRDKMNKRWQKK